MKAAWNSGIAGFAHRQKQPLNRTARRQQAVCQRPWQPTRTRTRTRANFLRLCDSTPATARVVAIPGHGKRYAEKYLHWAKCFFSKFTEPDIVSFREEKTGQVAFSLTPNFIGVYTRLNQNIPSLHLFDVFTFDSLIKAFS